MEIQNLHFAALQNEEHFKFQTDFKGLVELFTPTALGIEPLYAAYLPFYANEEEALDVNRKSSITNDLAVADDLRDATFIGLAGTVKSSANHYKAEVRASAARLQVLFNNYGNIAIKSYDKETTALDQLIADLQGSYAADIATLGHTEWVTELKAQNTAFDNLKKTRHTEDAGKTLFKMKEERGNVDERYRAIVKRINALIEVNGDAAYSGFVAELNNRISYFNNAIAQRKGRNAKGKDAPSTPPVTPQQ